MNRLKIVITGAVFGLLINANAQSTRVEVPTEVFRNELRDGGLPAKYNGSPYLNDEFVPGKIIMENTNEYSNGMLRFNAYSDQIEIKKADQTSVLLKRPYIKAEINNEIIAIKPFNEDGRVKNAYFIVLTDGKYTLLRKEDKIFYPEENDLSSTYSSAKPPRFVDDPKYFFSVNNEPAEKIKLKKKAILKKLSAEDNADAIISEKSLNLNKSEDIIQLLNELNLN